MKREDVRKVFPDATDEQVSAILNSFSEELNPVKNEKSKALEQLAAVKADGDAAKAELEALRSEAEGLRRKAQEGMTAEELLAQREAAAAEREREFLLKSNRLDARAVLIEAGIPADAMDSLLDKVVSENTVLTVELAKAIAQVKSSAESAATQAAQQKALEGTPDPQGAPGKGVPTTRAEFKALSFEQQLRLKESDPGIIARLK